MRVTEFRSWLMENGLDEKCADALASEASVVDEKMSDLDSLFIQGNLEWLESAIGNPETAFFGAVAKRNPLFLKEAVGWYYNFCLSISPPSIAWALAAKMNVREIETLLKQGLPTGELNYLPMIDLAIRTGSLPIVELLVEHGVDIEKRSPGDASSLHAAAREGNIEIVRYLLDKGMDANIEDCCNTRPLHTAASAEVVVALVEAGAGISPATLENETPLHTIMEANPNLDTVVALLANGADIYAEDHLSRTALCHAALLKNWLPFCLLFKLAGYDFSQEPSSLLHDAVYYNNPGMVQWLLKNGVKSNPTNECAKQQDIFESLGLDFKTPNPYYNHESEITAMRDILEALQPYASGQPQSCARHQPRGRD